MSRKPNFITKLAGIAALVTTLASSGCASNLAGSKFENDRLREGLVEMAEKDFTDEAKERLDGINIHWAKFPVLWAQGFYSKNAITSMYKGLGYSSGLFFSIDHKGNISDQVKWHETGHALLDMIDKEQWWAAYERLETDTEHKYARQIYLSIEQDVKDKHGPLTDDKEVLDEERMMFGLGYIQKNSAHTPDYFLQVYGNIVDLEKLKSNPTKESTKPHKKFYKSIRELLQDSGVDPDEVILRPRQR